MSVAFRRESDEEHREPRFELPIPAGPNWVTPEGPALIAARAAAVEAALAAATDEEARAPLARELRYWRTRAATAQVAAPPAPDEVGIGSRVVFHLDGRERTVRIVGHDEADGDTRIAFAAPLSRALMGTGAGDMVDFQNRAEAIEVVAVENG